MQCTCSIATHRVPDCSTPLRENFYRTHYQAGARIQLHGGANLRKRFHEELEDNLAGNLGE